MLTTSGSLHSVMMFSINICTEYKYGCMTQLNGFQKAPCTILLRKRNESVKHHKLPSNELRLNIRIHDGVQTVLLSQSCKQHFLISQLNFDSSHHLLYRRNENYHLQDLHVTMTSPYSKRGSIRTAS